MRVLVSPNYMCDVTAYSSITKGKLTGAGYYQGASYLDWEYLYSITNSGNTLSINNFQIIQTVGQSAAQLFGSAGNRASNIKHIKAVWGINRISGTQESATGVPYYGAGWRPYDETLLASATASTSAFTLSEPASAFNRIKMVVGSLDESRGTYECNAPIADGNEISVRSYWGNNTATNMMAITRYSWQSGTTVLSSISGKAYTMNWASANPWTAVGATANQNWLWRPVSAVYGINRK